MRALPAVALLAAGACALSIEGTVRGAPRAPGSSFAGAANEAAGLRVTLNGGERSTVTRADGRFGFDGLAPGVYLVEIAPAPLPARGGGYATGNGGPEHAWVYSTYKVQLSEGAPAGSSSGAAAAAGGVQVLEYRYPGAPKLPAAYPIDAVPVARGSFFEERPRTSVLGLLKNPTVIMMLVMAFMALGMPALMVRARVAGVVLLSCSLAVARVDPAHTQRLPCHALSICLRRSKWTPRRCGRCRSSRPPWAAVSASESS